MRAIVLALVLAGLTMQGCSMLFEDDGPRLCRGQEIDRHLFDAQHCGYGDECVVCSAAPAHAAPACLERSRCGYECLPGFADCNLQVADGCEQDISDDPAHCGGCNRFCHGECTQGVCHAHWEGESTVVAISDASPPFSRSQEWLQVLWLRTDGGSLDLRYIADSRGTVATLLSVPLASGATPLLDQDDGNVYFTNGGVGDAGVLYSARGLPDLEVLASGIGAPGGLRAAGDTVYWTSPSTGEVLQSARADGGTRVVASGQDRPGPLVADSRNLYWINQGRSAVMALPLDGGTPRTVSTQPFVPGPLALFLWSRTVVTIDQRTFTDLSFPVWADLNTGVIWGAPDGVAQPLTAPDAGVLPSQLLSANGVLRIFDAARAELVGSCEANWPDGDGGLPLRLCDQASYPPDVLFLGPGLHFTDGGSIDTLPR